MAVDLFLKLDGIDGESQDTLRPKQIDILGWTWDVTTPSDVAGIQRGKVQVGAIIVTKLIDKATVSLLRCLAQNVEIKHGEILARKAGDDPLEFYVIKMKRIRVSAINSSPSKGDDDKMIERVHLSFVSSESIYRPQKSTGSGGAEIAFELSWAEVR